MNQKPYLALSAVIFGVVALLHLFRAINRSVFQIGTWTVPVFVSWVAVVVAGALCIWGLRLASRG